MSDHVTNSERIILVTGATGRQRGAVYQQLRKRGFKLRALVRDPGSKQARQLIEYGEKVFQGSLDDSDSLIRAMEGMYRVFSVQPYTANEIQQGAAVIEAARRQGVSHFVYSSVGSADERTGIPHFESKVQSGRASAIERLAAYDCAARLLHGRTGREGSASRSGTGSFSSR